MKCACASLLFCLLLSGSEARSLGRHGAAEALAQQRIAPSLQPESSKKFFDKDYPSDRRPAVDVLHFKHPYPVVQDSGDFDADYVKDENSDNGNWKAQQEYDRLRHKLAKEKKEAAKALDKRKEEEKELQKALDKYSKEVAENKAETAKKQAEADKQVEKKPEEEKKPAEPKKEEKTEGWSWDWWPFSWPKWGEAAPAPAPKKEGSGINRATEQTEKAMDNLEDCQKELERAKEQMKKRMDDLEKAKGKQSDADSAVDKAAKKQLETQKLADDLHGKSSTEKAEHEDAEAAYLKQKAVVDKMKADLKAAAAKVKAIRDAEDRGGGVYPTPSQSMSISISSPHAAVLLLMAAVASQLA